MSGLPDSIFVIGRLLGTVSFTCAGRPLVLPPSSAALLAFLLTRKGKPVERAKLGEVVDGCDVAEGPARRRVNTAVWRLRRLLEPAGVTVTSVGGGLVVSADRTVWVDAVEFESACAALARFDVWTTADARE